jgi:hypothetical protein
MTWLVGNTTLRYTPIGDEPFARSGLGLSIIDLPAHSTPGAPVYVSY